MLTHLTKWENSLGIRIPRSYAEQLGITEGTAVEIMLEADHITIRRKSYILNSLVKQITPDNLHQEIITGQPRGSEIW